MTHLILSPHADDAVLSCGGLMYTLAQEGQPVVVWTLMVADAPKPLPPSSLVNELHLRWETEKDPYAMRRAEDKVAVEYLGAEVVFGEWLDAIYRVDTNGRVIYPDLDFLFDEIRPNEPLLSASLDLTRWPDLQAVYIPLAAGNHVDHQVVRQLALRWLQSAPASIGVYFYEEYPYAAETNEITHFYSGKKPPSSGSRAVQKALASLSSLASSVVREFDEVALQAKIKAIACYASQISSFWNNTDEMAQNVREYARVVGSSTGVAFGERLWILNQNI
jgi:LmbE family N-acetylglucosaminyl deacetylase